MTRTIVGIELPAVGHATRTWVLLLPWQDPDLFAVGETIHVQGSQRGKGPSLIMSAGHERAVLGRAHIFSPAALWVFGLPAAAMRAIRSMLRALPAGAMAAVRAVGRIPRLCRLALSFLVQIAAIGLSAAALIASGLVGLVRRVLSPQTLRRIVRGIAIATRRALAAGASAVRGCATFASKVPIWIARAVIALVRGVLAITRGALTAVRAIARFATRLPTWIAHGLNALGRGVLALTRGALTAVRAIARFAARLPTSIAHGLNALARGGLAITRGALTAVRAIARFAAKLPAWIAHGLIALGRTVFVLMVVIALLAARVWPTIVSAMATAARWARAAPRAALQFALRLARPTPLRVLLAVPVVVVLLGASTGATAAVEVAPTSEGRPTLVFVGWFIFFAGMVLAINGAVAAVRFKRTIAASREGTTCRIVQFEAARGIRRIRSAGRVTVELPSGRERRFVVLSLVGGQKTVHLSRATDVNLHGQLSPRATPIGLAVGEEPPLLCRAELYGPVRVSSLAVLTAARRTIRGALWRPSSLVAVALVLVLVGLAARSSAILLLASILCLSGVVWMLTGLYRHRELGLLLSHGGAARQASVTGTVRAAWYARWAIRETVWLQTSGSDAAGQLEVRLLRGRASSPMQPGDSVTVYRNQSTFGSALLVGSGIHFGGIGRSRPLNSE